MRQAAGSERDWIAEPSLIAKYRLGIPQYATYPGAERFGEDFGPADALGLLRQMGEAAPALPLAISVHWPMPDGGDADGGSARASERDPRAYLAYLEREIVTQRGAIGRDEEVADLLWTGGSPGHPSVEEASRILESLRGYFRFRPDGSLRIEVGPWHASAEAIEGLGSLGFNSLAIRAFDLDPAVQRQMGWSLSPEEAERALSAGRTAGFGTVSLELLCGLPAQSAASLARTLQAVGEIRPDRVRLGVFSSGLRSGLRGFDPGELPGEDEKAAMLASSLGALASAGYVPVGMDEFALDGDELALARARAGLYRDLHGYGTRACGGRLAFGVAATSALGAAYAQNHSSLADYCARLDRGELPVRRGLRLDADDLLRREIIGRIACDLRLEFAELARRFGIDFQRHFGPEVSALDALATDGLIEHSASGFEVTALGVPLLGAVCRAFDRYAPRHGSCCAGNQREGRLP